MKKTAIIFSILFISFPCIAQNKKDSLQVSKSKLESFSEKAGSMFKKEYFKIAQLHDLTFELLTITNLETSESVQGLRISTTSTIGTTGITWAAFLDQDEIDGFLKAVTYMSSTVMKDDFPTNFTEFTFQSRGGFSATIFNVPRIFNEDKQKWKAIFKLKAYDSNTTVTVFIGNNLNIPNVDNVSVPTGDFPKIKDAIVFAHTKLSD